jgi:opacity protein-like surface antigen
LPLWLTDLSLGVKESYDDNVLYVSGNGLPEQSSWVNTVSVKLGVDFAPLLAAGGAVQSLTLVYSPEKATYAQASAEDYTAHRINDLFKGKVGNLTYSLNNAFLYNDGNRLAETYALNQLSGAAANQNDKYRNSLAHAAPRERRNQDQDRYMALLQYDAGNLFFRPVSSLTLYKLNTYLFNTSLAPYEGYQDYVNRYDVNIGADLGYRLGPDLAVTLGARDGYQYQEQFALAINSDRHFSSNHYQRVLAGLEGKLMRWLDVKLSAGPDIREYNPQTPITDLNTTRYYGEAAATATLSRSQSLALTYKQWFFVSSTGLVPYEDISYTLVYHWTATKQLGVDVGAKFLNHNYTFGDDMAGSAPSLRDDVDYGALGGLTYAFTPHLVASLNYNYDDGQNAFASLPAKYAPFYRDFKHALTAVGLQYKF